jgi:hypothetical protein
MSDPSSSTSDVRSSRPSEAGIYDYFVGGTHYNAADRAAAEEVLVSMPEAPFAVTENRRFLKRAAEYVANQGVRQYIDLGSGYPTGGQVHEVVERIVPNPHVVYVDHDPHVAEESRELLRGYDTAVTITQDIRHPWAILDDPEVVRLIDWSEPVTVLAVAVLHFIPDEERPREIIATFREHMVPGSYLALSHVWGGENPDGVGEGARIWDKAKSQVVLRDPSEVEELFVGFELVEPGIVTATEWGTSEPPPSDQGGVLCGVGKVEPD